MIYHAIRFWNIACFAAATLLMSNECLQAQGLSPNGRAAALRMAITAGFEVPKSDIVVISDGYFGMDHAPSEVIPVATQRGDANSVARLLSASVGISSDKALTCRQQICAPTTATAVLVVMEPVVNRSGESVVAIRLYRRPPEGTERDAILNQITVEVQKVEGGWIGVRTRLLLPQTKIKLPPPG